MAQETIVAEGKALSLRDVLGILKPAPGGQFTAAQDDLLAKFYDLYTFREAHEAMDAFLKKANCGNCRTTLMTIMAQQPDRLQQFVDAIDWAKFLGRKPTDLKDALPARATADAPVQPVQARRGRPVSIAGTTRDIDDTPEAYTAMMEHINGQNGYFSGLTVRVLPDTRLRVYFY